MRAYEDYPLQTIIDILVKERRSALSRTLKKPMWAEDEAFLYFVVEERIKRIKEIKTKEEINQWLLKHRGLTLQEWIDSL